MYYSRTQSIDFEQWRRLASQDPEGFEAQRLVLIEAVIGAASQRRQRRLRGLQWRIDQMRARASNPMAACISLSTMMWESFAGEGGLEQVLNRQHAAKESNVLPQAAVHPFPPCSGR
jgi:hypothetical protein